MSSSRLYDFNLLFLFGSDLQTFPAMEKVFRRNITKRIYITEYLKGLKIDESRKLSKDGKLTAKRGSLLDSFLK